MMWNMSLYQIRNFRKKGKEFREELISTLKLLSSKLKYSQCWDKNGWFWQPAVEAKSKLIKIEFDALLNE